MNKNLQRNVEHAHEYCEADPVEPKGFVDFQKRLGIFLNSVFKIDFLVNQEHLLEFLKTVKNLLLW